ncbi:terpenoid cyclases/Protein prenyltransferase [Xylariaceae sp. FL0255]|nr:terpenoid cyclases/Protein prenyltransferase [Xylariaceae sp. FL0255]
MPVKTSLARARLKNKLPKRTILLSSAANEYIEKMASQGVPSLFTTAPLIKDFLTTETSDQQIAVVDDCIACLAGHVDSVDANVFGVPSLSRDRHCKFLEKNLGPLPGSFKMADASRPWYFYWCLNGLSLLGADVSVYRDGLVETARSIQNKEGGFGGGFGQQSHLATTYATVLALAIVGGDAAYEVIDRRAMWKWLCTLKQPNGGFRMTLGGEVDIRGAYCAAVIISILNLPLELSPDSPLRTEKEFDLFTGLTDYVRQCQTFEGGISARPDSEAHGAYAFCALGCLSVLDAPHRIFKKYLNMPRLISWLSSRQYAPEGGFSGRTNKLVDGCYSHWVGGCWPLVNAAVNGPVLDVPSEPTLDANDMYSREGLIRYILCCGQDQTKRGGMRDKPYRPSDAYHTCYVLSGLSSAQHSHRVSNSSSDESLEYWTYEVSPLADDAMVYDKKDQICPTDPVFAIPQVKREMMMAYFHSKPGF